MINKFWAWFVLQHTTYEMTAYAIIWTLLVHFNAVFGVRIGILWRNKK